MVRDPHDSDRSRRVVAESVCGAILASAALFGWAAGCALHLTLTLFVTTLGKRRDRS